MTKWLFVVADGFLASLIAMLLPSIVYRAVCERREARGGRGGRLRLAAGSQTIIRGWRKQVLVSKTDHSNAICENGGSSRVSAQTILPLGACCKREWA